MKSFINLKTGLVETPVNELVIEQYKKYADVYKEVSKEPTLNELRKKAKELGIKYNNKNTKDELLALINGLD